MAKAKMSTLERISRIERAAWGVEREAQAEAAEGLAEEQQGLLMGWLSSGGLTPFPFPTPILIPPIDKPDREEVFNIYRALVRAVVDLKTTIDQMSERVVLIEEALVELKEEIDEEEEEEAEEEEAHRGKGKGRK